MKWTKDQQDAAKMLYQGVDLEKFEQPKKRKQWSYTTGLLVGLMLGYLLGCLITSGIFDKLILK